MKTIKIMTKPTGYKCQILTGRSIEILTDRDEPVTCHAVDIRFRPGEIVTATIKVRVSDIDLSGVRYLLGVTKELERL